MIDKSRAMDKKMLIAIDGSKAALKALDYVGEHFSEVTDLQITLFLVLQGIPPDLWDDGHILSEAEKKDRRAVLDKLIVDQKLKAEPIFQTALEALTRKGINSERIERRKSLRFLPGAIKQGKEMEGLAAGSKGGRFSNSGNHISHCSFDRVALPSGTRERQGGTYVKNA
jgi:hypothetical protein